MAGSTHALAARTDHSWAAAESAWTEARSMYWPSSRAAIFALVGAASCGAPASLGSVTPTTAGDTIAVWLTNSDRSALLARQPTIAFGSGASSSPTITVDGATTYQTM